jgi:hypothetical protein
MREPWPTHALAVLLRDRVREGELNDDLEDDDEEAERRQRHLDVPLERPADRQLRA